MYRIFFFPHFARRHHHQLDGPAAQNPRRCPEIAAVLTNMHSPIYFFTRFAPAGAITNWTGLLHKIRDEERKHHRKPVTLLQWSADGRHLLSADEGGKAVVWSTEVTHETLQVIPTPPQVRPIGKMRYNCNDEKQQVRRRLHPHCFILSMWCSRPSLHTPALLSFPISLH